MPILLDSDTITISRGVDGGCSQLFFSSKSPHPPSSPPAFPSQPNLVSTSITHPDTHPQPPSVQLWAIPPSPLLSAAAAPTSTNQNDDSPAACPPLSTSTCDPLLTAVSLTPSAEANDGPPAAPSATLSPHLPPSHLSPPHLSPPQNVILTINHAQPSTVSSASSSTVPLASDPAEYFRNKVGPQNTSRIEYLVQATQAFIKSANLDQRTFTTVLGLWSNSFDKSDSGLGPIKRLQRLARGYAKIEHYFTDLLYIIYFAHECDLVAQSENKKVGKGKGRRRKSEALSKTAKALGMVEKAVSRIKSNSRNYRLLLQQGGPGSLLQIGPDVDTIWQHRLNKDDIPILLEYRKDHLPDLDKQAHELDLFASEILIAGMAAFGWSHDELAATGSELTKSIQPHKDLQKLAQGMERLTITIPLLGVGEGPGASEDGIQKKRRRSDSDNADRPVKQVRLSQSFEEPDISMITGLSPTPEQPDMSIMTGLSRMPGELEMPMMMELWLTPEQPDMSMITELSRMPGELDMSMMMMEFSPMPRYSQEYENWANETHGWK